MSTVLSRPSLDLNWLPQSLRKGIQLPTVVITKTLPRTQNAAGAYYEPWHGEEWFDGRPISNPNGILGVREDSMESAEDFATTLIHEWRHHWQRFNAPFYYDAPRIKPHSYGDDYLTQFFTTSRCEFDALLFEVKYAPDDENLRRLGLVKKFFEAQQ